MFINLVGSCDIGKIWVYSQIISPKTGRGSSEWCRLMTNMRMVLSKRLFLSQTVCKYYNDFCRFTDNGWHSQEVVDIIILHIV